MGCLPKVIWEIEEGGEIGYLPKVIWEFEEGGEMGSLPMVIWELLGGLGGYIGYSFWRGAVMFWRGAVIWDNSGASWRLRMVGWAIVIAITIIGDTTLVTCDLTQLLVTRLSQLQLPRDTTRLLSLIRRILIIRVLSLYKTQESCRY